MIPTFEVIAILFLILMSYLTFLSYKRKEFSKFHLVFWLTVWIVGIIGIIFNKSFEPILISLNMSRTFDLYTLLAFVFLFFITFHTYKVVKNNERRLEKIARYVTLKPLEKLERNESSYFS